MSTPMRTLTFLCTQKISSLTTVVFSFAFVGMVASLGSVAFAVNGVTANEIVIGSSASTAGASSDRAQGIRRASDAAFAKVNNAGGINGRKIKVIALDDNYSAPKAVENAKRLIETDKVFALYGFFGAPMSKAVLPTITSTKTLFLFPGSGSEALRNPVQKTIFNVRLSYAQEVEPIIEYLVNKKQIKNIAIVYQDDSLGQEGKFGAQKALSKYNLTLAASAPYVRESVKFETLVQTLLAAKPGAIIMGASGDHAAEFAKLARAAGYQGILAGPSSIATETFVQISGKAGEGTIVSQGFPPADTNLPIIKEFNDAIKAANIKESAHIEGYMNALVFIEALKRCGNNVTQDEFMKALESMRDVDFGGLKVSYSKDDHQGLKTGFLQVVKDGKYVTLTP